MVFFSCSLHCCLQLLRPIEFVVATEPRRFIFSPFVLLNLNMNCKGILRKTTSPIRKRNLSTHLVNTRPNRTIDNVQLIDHNHVSDSDDSFDIGISNKYQFSTINTTQKTKNKLQQLRNLSVKDATLAELSPRSKGVVAEKVKLFTPNSIVSVVSLPLGTN